MPSTVPVGSVPTKKKKSRAKASAKPARNFSGGDQVLVTLCHFMRVTFWYLELCAATAEGDIGRVFEVIKVHLNSYPFYPHLTLVLQGSPVLILGCWVHKLRKRAA